MGFPGMETAPPEQVTRAALFGGTTTLVDFAEVRAGIELADEFPGSAEFYRAWRGTPLALVVSASRSGA